VVGSPERPRSGQSSRDETTTSARKKKPVYSYEISNRFSWPLTGMCSVSCIKRSSHE
jgi:hypothetical protein